MAYKHTPMPHAATKRKRGAPRPHERRAGGLYPFYRLAVYRPVSLTYFDDPSPYKTWDEAVAAAHMKPGKYRISTVTMSGAATGEPFVVTKEMCKAQWKANLTNMAGGPGDATPIHG